MKRVDFDPNKKDRKAENRGKSGYERISWDEALDIIEQEMIRIRREYGPGTVLTTPSSHHSWGIIGYRHSAYLRFVDIMGFTYIEHNPDSWEGWLYGAPHMYGFEWNIGTPEQNDLLTDALQNVEMVVLWSSDPESTMATYAAYESNPWRQWLKELGVKFVIIDPFYNYTAVNFADKWIAPKPGTDAALAAAIAHVWIKEGTYDKWFVENRTIGFDKFRDYIMGKEDGTPKTPEWAERITGVPAREIRALAREWARKRTMLGPGNTPGEVGASREAYGHEFARFMIALVAMQGLGKPGVNLWSTNTGSPIAPNVPEDVNPYGFLFPGYADGGISGDTSNSGAARIISRGFVKIPVTNRVAFDQHVLRTLTPEAVMNPPVEWRGKGFNTTSIETQFKKYKYPEDGYSEAHAFWRYGASYIGTMTNTNRWVRMYRSPKLEFVVNQNPWFEGEAKFADLILPACTSFERWDIGEIANIGGYVVDSVQRLNYRVIVLMMKAIEPLGESRSDYDIFAMVAKRLGFYERYTEGGMTQLDWVRRFYERSDLSKYISWEEFKRKGYFVVPVKKRPITVAFRWFYEGRRKDTVGPVPAGGGVMSLPDMTGLSTQSGKIEFESNSLKRFDPNDPERPPVPHYIPSWEGPDTPLAKKYPLQLISPHPRYSFHTQYDAKETWVDEIPEHRRRGPDGYFYRVMRINPADAAPRGIRDGDLVKVY
ncbi:MAG: molybdopterin-dependent oxidoreductase, partial [Nitrososphaeria archaeon]